MKKIARILGVLIALLTLAIGVYAREPVPIIYYNDIAIVTGTGKPITSEQVRTAITTAATAHKWEIAKSPNQDLLSATLRVRDKHTVVVSIPYSVEKFSIKYESSINMKYSPIDTTPSYKPGGISASGPTPVSTPMIHPYYNRWIQELMQSIKLELTKL
jgi:hypothetical protein